MPLPSFLERFRRGASEPPAGARAPTPSDVEALRTRARRRLIGMVVLVGAGVLGFPWLFETQPRPMSPQVRIVQSGAAAQPEADASPRTSAGRVVQAERRQPQVASITPPAETTEAQQAPVTGAPVVPPASQEAPPAEVRAETRQAPAAPSTPKVKPSDPPRQADKVAPRGAEKAAEKAPEKAAEKKAEVKPAPKPDAKPSDTRYVVQFGAFADVNAARETRQKAERLGLKTYAQQVDTPQGKRIRVRLGPFADKAEADKALATLRKGGLNGNILTL